MAMLNNQRVPHQILCFVDFMPITIGSCGFIVPVVLKTTIIETTSSSLLVLYQSYLLCFAQYKTNKNQKLLGLLYLIILVLCFKQY